MCGCWTLVLVPFTFIFGLCVFYVFSGKLVSPLSSDLMDHDLASWISHGFQVFLCNFFVSFSEDTVQTKCGGEFDRYFFILHISIVVQISSALEPSLNQLLDMLRKFPCDFYT